MSQPQPATEKLSDHIGTFARIFEGDVLLPEQLGMIVDFHRRYLKHLQLFADDFEYAESQAPGPHATSLAAAASMRFYRRLTAPTPPIAGVTIAVRAPDIGPMPSAVVVNLDRFRRPPADRSPAPEGGAA